MGGRGALASAGMTDTDVRAALESWTPPRTAEWNPGWRSALASWAEPHLDLVEDAAWGAQVRDAVGLPVDDPLLWANQRIQLPSGGWAVTGIRFRGRDVTKPFVDVIATSVTPDAAGLGELAAVLPAYAAFAPLCLRVHLPGAVRATTFPAPADFVATPDQFVVAGPVAAVRERPGRPGSGAVALGPIDPEEAAVRCAAIYADVRRTHPALGDWATPAEAEDLEDAADEALLFGVLVDGQPAGVVAAVREDAYGLTGFLVEEIALDTAHRGKRLGPVVLQRLAERLPAGPSDVLWGHVHPDNTPSLRNALASGREVVSTLVWITPEGSPGMA